MLLPGTRFGTYELIAPLGAGGMGEVYRARDTNLGRDVASTSALSRSSCRRDSEWTWLERLSGERSPPPSAENSDLATPRLLFAQCHRWIEPRSPCGWHVARGHANRNPDEPDDRVDG